GINGTLAGQRWTTGRYRTGLEFDGTSYVTVPDSTTLHLTAGLTLSAWVRPMGDQPCSAAVVIKEAQGGMNYALASADDCEGPDFCTGKPSTGYSCAAGAELPGDAWTFLAGTYDGSTYRLYVNGQLANSATGNATPGTSTKPLRIGGDGVWGDFFVGIIDEVRIYNRALSSAEIQGDMQTPVNDTGPDTT